MDPSILSSQTYTSSLQWVTAKHAFGGHFPKTGVPNPAAAPPEAVSLRPYGLEEPLIGAASLVGLTVFASFAINYYEEKAKEKAARAEEKEELMEETAPMEDGPRRGGIRAFKQESDRGHGRFG